MLHKSLLSGPQPVMEHLGSDVLWLDDVLEVTLRCNGTESYPISYAGNSLRFDRLHQVFYRSFRNWGLLSWLRLIFSGLTTETEPSTLTEAAVLKKVVRQTMTGIHKTSFVPWKFHKRRSTFEPEISAKREVLKTVTIEQNACPSVTILDPASFFTNDESYELRIENGTTTLTTNTTIGTLRALETFKQLFYAHSTKSGIYTPFAPVRILDRPHWGHRGLSLDVARNTFAPVDARRTIDAMATTKLNRLHLHATDSQSWPLEVPSLPELARKGAHQPDSVWSTQDLQQLQEYGVHRGVSVYIEIDMPGHTASIAHAYPDLISAFSQPDWATFAAEPLSGQLKLNSSSVRTFIDSLLGDLLPRMRSYTSLYHVGGDEVNLASYLLDDSVRSADPIVLQPLVQHFFDQVFSHTLKNNLQPVVWDEMLLEWNLTLPSDTLVQVWRNSDYIARVLEAGHRVIFGSHQAWYLDCGFGQFLDPYPSGLSPPNVPFNTTGGRPSRLKAPYLDYCGPYHNWRAMFVYDPLANISSDLYHLVEGGEVLLWSEQTDSVDLDFKLWPRAASAAEVLWAGVRNASMIASATRRLGEWRERLVLDHGISASPVQMEWCLMESGCEF